MGQDVNEILFNKNKRGKEGLVKINAQDAKKLIQLMEEHASQKTKTPMSIINLYTKKIQNSKRAIENKLQENKVRPFEFLVIQN
jgi:hypothetical protein